METFLAAKSFLLISVSKKLLNNENKIILSSNISNQQTELSNSLYKFRYNEENNENLVFIFAFNANYKFKLNFNSKEKGFNINVYDFKSNDFWEMKIENEDFFYENSEQSFKVCENTGLIEEAKKYLSNLKQMLEIYNDIKIKVNSKNLFLVAQIKKTVLGQDMIALSQINEKINKLKSLNEQLFKALREQNLNELNQLSVEIDKITIQNNSISNGQSGQKVEKPKKCNKKLLGFGIATVVAFLVTLFFGIATFGFGLFSMLLGGILFGVSAGATIVFGVPFAIFIKNERGNEKTSKLCQEVLLPGGSNLNIPAEPAVNIPETNIVKDKNFFNKY